MSIFSDYVLPASYKLYRAISVVLVTIAYNSYALLSYLLGRTLLKKRVADTAAIEHPIKAYGWAARDSSGVLSPFKFSRRATREYDVQFKVMYCGICHSDLHLAKNEFGNALYPMVPGHEIVGIVTEIGSKVQKVKVGDAVGVGCMVGSCGDCEQCDFDHENYCPRSIFTYNSIDTDGTATYGGYSDIMVADEHFIIRWPENFPLDRGAPLLCAGITTYSAMKYYGMDALGQHIGVVGLGGLGHVAVKFAKAFGVKVTVISSSAGKRKDAIDNLGADGFLHSRDAGEMAAAAGTLDCIINTVSAALPMQPLIELLKPNAVMVIVGLPANGVELPVMPLAMGRKAVAGSLIGGVKETQEMIDFAAEHDILADVEIIPMDYVNKAMERLARGDVKYRFVIDVGNTVKAE